jgi:hypothetical protein
MDDKPNKMINVNYIKKIIKFIRCDQTLKKDFVI